MTILMYLNSSLSNVDLESVVLQELQALKTVRPGSCLQADTFLSESLKKCVTSIRMSEISELEFLNETVSMPSNFLYESFGENIFLCFLIEHR